MTHPIDFYRQNKWGYFVIIDDLMGTSHRLQEYQWCGMIISSMPCISTIDWVSKIPLKPQGLKATFDDYNMPTMIQYLELQNHHLLIDLLKQTYDDYYAIYEHGFLKRFPFIRVPHTAELHAYMQRYDYHYSNRHEAFIHNRYIFL
jgi:hypothetical protein